MFVLPQLLRVLVCYVVACGLCLECPDDEGGHLVAGDWFVGTIRQGFGRASSGDSGCADAFHGSGVFSVGRHVGEEPDRLSDFDDGGEGTGEEHGHVKAGNGISRSECSVFVGFDHAEVGHPFDVAEVPGVVGHVGEAAGGGLRIAFLA